MKILDRYVLQQFFRILLVCVVGVPFIFIIINLTDQLDNFLADDLTSGSILAHYLFQIPYYMLLSFPIAALLAAVFTISNMTRHFEISAAKAGGLGAVPRAEDLTGTIGNTGSAHGLVAQAWVREERLGFLGRLTGFSAAYTMELPAAPDEAPAS